MTSGDPTAFGSPLSSIQRRKCEGKGSVGLRDADMAGVGVKCKVPFRVAKRFVHLYLEFADLL